MLFDAHNIVAWHGRTTAQHIAQRDHFEHQGFVPLSLSIYGSPEDPRFAAVMVHRPVLSTTRSFIGLTRAQYQQTCEAMAQQGFGACIVTATGPADRAVFCACYRKMPRMPVTHAELTREQFSQVNRQQQAQGAILLWADVFGTEQEPRYCAIWAPNPERVAWNLEAIDAGGMQRQQHFDAMSAIAARPALLAVTPAQRMLEMFVDSHIGRWAARVGMTSEDYRAEIERQARHGLWPVCVSAAGEGSATRFAAIFQACEAATPRILRSTGSFPVVAIDAALESYVQDHNLRGAALAIVAGTRLVYARAYTFAENAPVYHDIQPITPFRLGALAKTFCAVAVWKLIEQQQLTLDTTLQSVLQLSQPDGSEPRDPRFAQITVRHLLESSSGIPQGAVWNAAAASAAAGSTLPVDGLEMARWIATLELTGQPGAIGSTVYGATDYFLLGLIVARQMHVASFEAALALLVLNPLGQKHTRGARSLASVQLADEARHHLTVHDLEHGWPLTPLATATSVRTPDQPLVPLHYGAYDYEMLDGCGGLSASVIDVARLCAMFACRSGNPVLTPKSIDAMLAAAVDATQRRPHAHGYHGLDWAAHVDAESYRIQFSKADWLPGQGSHLIGTTGGLCFVFAQNGNSRPEVATQWLEPIQAVAASHDEWDDIDLFPSYGMAALPSAVPSKLSSAPFFRAPMQGWQQVATSLGASLAQLSHTHGGQPK